MGCLDGTFEEPCFWDQRNERRVFIDLVDQLNYGVFWMRGYCGLNKRNRFASIPESPERQFAEGHIRRMAREKDWIEMRRCPECYKLFSRLTKTAGKCDVCSLETT